MKRRISPADGGRQFAPAQLPPRDGTHYELVRAPLADYERSLFPDMAG